MSAPIVTTTSGPVRGELLGSGAAVFRGIPFAAPPLGAHRFGPPRPVEPWPDVRDATAFGPASVQPTGGLGMFGPAGLPVDEDCLSLNVWTPGCDDQRRPVMVWIHGGAFRMGTAGAPSYDGRALAERGDVVVVSANYRLGLLGFLVDPDRGVANAALHDQIAALRWVRDEIERFGGDPDQVTVFGESAGAKSVECLLAAPAARGLFRRAILQSTYATALDAERPADRARAIAAHLGTDVGGLADVPLDALLAAEAAVVATAGPEPIGSGGGGPVVDGDLLPVEPLVAIGDGAASDVDLLVGTTLDEFMLFALMGMPAGGPPGTPVAQRLAAILGLDDPDDPAVAAAIEAYTAERTQRGASADDDGIVHDAMTDRMFRQHSLRVAEAAAEHGQVHAYLFTWTSPVPALGACHGLELPFVFGTLDASADFAGTGPAAEALSSTIQDAWLAFARTGRPGTDPLGPWPAYDATRRATMVLGATCCVHDAPMEPIRELWSGRSL